MKTLLIALMLLAAGSVAQETPTPAASKKVIRRIKINYADPYLIMLLLRGERATQPEYSTISSTTGGQKSGNTSQTGTDRNRRGG